MKRLLWLIPLFFTCVVFAQPNIETLFSLSLEELMNIEVTGSTLTSENVRTVPAAVTVFSHEELTSLGVDTLNELMNLVPGFQTYRSSEAPASYSSSSRARRIGFEAAEMLILIDGQRLNDPRSGGSTPIVSNLPLVNIERVEFIRGPGSAIYGSNAMMGVINIITRVDVNEVSVSYGQFNRKKIHLLASQQIEEINIDFFAHFETDQGDNYWLPDTFTTEQIKTDDPKKVIDLNLKLAWQDTQINFQHKQFSTKNFYQLSTLSNNFNKSSFELNTISFKQDFNWLAVSSYARINYNQTNASSSSQVTAPGELFLASGGASNDPLLVDADLDGVHESRFLWHNNWDINTNTDLQFGIEFRHIGIPESIIKNNFDLGDLANGNFPIAYYGDLLPTTQLLAKSSRDILGVYGQYQQQLFDSSHLTLGLRYDDFSAIGSEFTPRFAWVQEINEKHSLKLLYGEAFRAPTVDELSLSNNSSLLGNPDLIPESVKSIEFIWIGQWSNTMASLGYFENHFENSIVQVPLVDGTRQYQNSKQDPIKGIEVEISHQLSEHLLLRASFTHINEKSSLAYREADQLASLMINYQHDKWNANIISSYHDEREMPTQGSDNNLIKLSAYWQLFAKITYNITSDWEVFTQVKNLLDEEYLTPVIGSKLLTQGIPNHGREFLLGVVWQY